MNKLKYISCLFSPPPLMPVVGNQRIRHDERGIKGRKGQAKPCHSLAKTALLISNKTRFFFYFQFMVFLFFLLPQDSILSEPHTIRYFHLTEFSFAN